VADAVKLSLAERAWRFDEAGDPEKPFVCLGCGARAKSEGGINLHAARVHERRSARPAKRQIGAFGCKHKWRLLNRASPSESRALAAGYLAVCVTCDDLKGAKPK
jgi:hypothetical protein